MANEQAYLFFLFTLNGLIIGLLFDLFRISRRVFKTNNIITYIEDVIFWILSGFIILYSSFTFNNGELRFYMFIAILIGIIMYMLFVSSHIINICVTFLTILKNFFNKFIRIILIPFKFLYKIMRKFFMKPIIFLVLNLMGSFKKILKINNIFNIKKLTKNNKKQKIVVKN